MKKTLFMLCICVISLVMVISSIICFNKYKVSCKNKQLYNDLSNNVEHNEKIVTDSDFGIKANAIDNEFPTNTESKELNILEKYKDLYKKNPDLVGWVKIGNIIDYPVLMNKEDSDYYINRNFKKNDSKFGSIYLNNECDLSLKSSISLVYGHHMKDGSMFSSLTMFLDKKFYENNKIIELDSLYEESKYEVVGVFLSKIYNQEELEVFKHYNYKGILSEEEFNEYKDGVSNILSVGDLSEVKYGDTLVELITCSYHEDEGTLVVLCKKIEE